jgi:hypothetical protein
VSNNPSLPPSLEERKRKFSLVRTKRTLAEIEVLRAEWHRIADLHTDVEWEVSALEDARELYQDPAMRRLLDLPDDEFEAELEGRRARSAELWDRLGDVQFRIAKLGGSVL